MPDPILIFDTLSESLRVQTLEYLNSRGIKRTFLAKACNLSDTSISLFLSQRRILVQDKQNLIREFITKI